MSIQDLKDLILGWIPDNVMRLISPQRARNAYYSIIEFFWDVTGDKSDLETTDKSTLVNAINELKQTTGFVISEIILSNGQSFLFPEMNKGEAFVIRIFDEPNGTVWLGGYDGVAVGNDTLVICLSNSVGGSFSDVGNQFVIINQGADSEVIFVDELPDENLARTGVIYVLNSNNAMYVWDNQLGDYVLIGDVIPGTLISSTVFEDENNNVVIPEPNKLYFDTTSEIYYRWNGSEYVLLNQSDNEIIFTSEEPTQGVENKLYINLSSGTMKVWYNGGWIDLTFSLTTSNDGDIEFTGDGTPANPLSASVANKIPYKTIDTSVTEPNLAQLNAHGTDRVDFPNLDRIYLLNGAKWTYVETIDL